MALTDLVTGMSGYGRESYVMRPELLAFIWDACGSYSKLRKFAIDQCIIDARMDRFDTKSKKAYIQFAEDNEDFAREYIAASIQNGHRQRLDIYEDCEDYVSCPQSNTK